MKRSLLAPALALLALAGCQDGSFGQKKAPFVATSLPGDFAIVVNDNLETYYTRQHVQQVITAQDMMSRTTYRSFRDYNNTLSSSFSQEQPLTDRQMQAMWNEVSSNNLLAGGRPWMNWLSEADIYRHKDITVQIRANGQVKTYQATNGYKPQMRALMLLVTSVRLPIGQKGAPVVGRAGAVPAARPSASAPAVESALTLPGGPATSAPAMLEP